MEADTKFKVMGSTAHVIVVGEDPARLLTYAESRLRELEHRWTRFSDDSELMRLNASAGSTVEVHLDTFLLVLRSCDGWRLTDGRFDPTVHGSMLAAGYTAPGQSRLSFDQVGRAPGCANIQLDRNELTVTLPVGVALDPGGVGKGLAADLVATELASMGVQGALVNVGGDLRAVGQAPASDGWLIAVQDPFDPDATVSVPQMSEGAVATTTPEHRRWRNADGEGRHVIDPRSGRPSATDVASVTVLAAQAWMAEVVAKAAALVGFDDAIDVIDDAGLTGIVVSDNGRIDISARLGAFL